MCYFSLHLSLWPAAWVTFNEAGRLQPVLFLAAARLGMLHVYIFTSSLDVFLVSLSQSTFFELSPFFLALRASDRVLSERRPAHLSGRSRACVCVVSNSFNFFIARVGAGIWSCALPKERNRKKVVRSSPRPRCLGQKTVPLIGLGRQGYKLVCGVPTGCKLLLTMV